MFTSPNPEISNNQFLIATEKVCPSRRKKSKYLIHFLYLVTLTRFLLGRMSSEYIAAQPQKAGTVYRFIRVPELTQNANTVVLIKNSNQTDSSTITKVQKQVQQVAPGKIIESSGGKKVKTRVSLSLI